MNFKKQKFYYIIENANIEDDKNYHTIENSNVLISNIYSIEKIDTKKYYIKIKKSSYINFDKFKVGYTGVLYTETSVSIFKTNYNINFKTIKYWNDNYFEHFYILTDRDIILNPHFKNITSTKYNLDNNIFTLSPNNKKYKIFNGHEEIEINKNKNITIPNKIGKFCISLDIKDLKLHKDKYFYKNKIPVVEIINIKQNNNIITLIENKQLYYNFYIDWNNYYKSSNIFDLKIPKNIYTTGFDFDEENVGKVKFLIKWDKINSAIEYKIKYRNYNDINNINWKYINTKENKLVLRNLENNTKYAIAVATIYSKNKSSFFSQEIEVNLSHKI